jgi:hypothetical protein
MSILTKDEIVAAAITLLLNFTILDVSVNPPVSPRKSLS